MRHSLMGTGKRSRMPGPSAFALLLLMMTPGCREARRVPEPGALLLQLSCVPAAPAADELRAWIYDDAGALWSDTRLEGSGASICSAGTVLIQPGSFLGKLRVHLRAFAAGARVMDGMLIVTSLSGSRTFDLVLDPAVPADGDGDGVPDVIDDCPAVPDVQQSGCTLPDAAADVPGADAGVDAGGADTAVDAAAEIGPGVDAGASPLPQGASCAAGSECASGYCADGVCCTNDCVGPCRSCNQPSAVGMCQGYASGFDPEGECASGTACNGVGACGPVSVNRANGQLCTAGNQCASTFCVDGVCCDRACSDPCFSCGKGTCTTVTKTEDVPECSGTQTCNPNGRCVLKSG